MELKPCVVDDLVRSAVSALKQRLGSYTAAGKSMGGISGVYVKDIMSGKTKVIGGDTWQGMEPALRPYLSSSPPHEPPAPPAQAAIRDSVRKDCLHTGEPIVSDGRLMHPSEFVAMPVVGIAQAAEWNAPLMTFSEFAEANAIEYIPVQRCNADGCGAIKIEGRSMCPYYPDGTVVVFKPGVALRHGKRVIAKLKETQQVVFKIFYRLSNPDRVLLKSINDGGRDFVFSVHPKDNPFEWIYVVMLSYRNEADIDEELDSKGMVKDLSAEYTAPEKMENKNER